MGLYEDHLQESIRRLNEIADEVLIKEPENRMWDKLRRMAENSVLSTYLMEYADERIKSFSAVCPDESAQEKYKEELIIFLRGLIKRMI